MKKLTCLSAVIVVISFAAACYVKSRPIEQRHASSARTPSPYSLVPIPASAVHHQQSAVPRIHLWDSTSGNWSGYAVPGTSGSDTFTDVIGTWQVPTVTGSRKSTSYSSIWVGLDGYNNGTVEQLGTEQDWTSRGQKNYAWIEMYPAGAFLINGFPVNAGDTITAQVSYDATSGNFTLSIQSSTGASYSTAIAGSSDLRQSAEWIVEAPWSGRVLPLANFGTVNFANCHAIGSNGREEPISYWANADPLTMIDKSGGRATPSGLTSRGTAFSVKYSAK